jgi:hypothetical protein
MPNETIISVYDLDMVEGGVANTTEHHFSPDEYSSFKYGCNKTTSKYGEMLAMLFLAQYGMMLETEEHVSNIVIVSSPYKYAPTASSYLMMFFKKHVNDWLATKNLPSINSVKVHRNNLFQGDYATLNETDRELIFNDCQLYIDHNKIKDKKVIIIDDIRITGSHQRKLSSLMNGVASEIYFLYIAVMNHEISKSFPQVEDQINHSYVISIKDVFHFIMKDQFFINARICKYILQETNTFHLTSLLIKLPPSHLRDIYKACIGDGYYNMKRYRKNFLLIEKMYHSTVTGEVARNLIQDWIPGEITRNIFQETGEVARNIIQDMSIRKEKAY